MVVTAAGRGERMQSRIPKCMLRVDGVPLALMATWAFAKRSDFAQIILTVPPGWEEKTKIIAAELALGEVTVTPGGARRQDSVRRGVERIGADITHILVHDGARVLVTDPMIDEVVNALQTAPAVFPALPVTDTLHRWDGRDCTPGPSRNNLVTAQTPQGFRRDVLWEALSSASAAERLWTDEVSLVREVVGVPVAAVNGEMGNIKLTKPGDLAFYAPQLRARARQVKRWGSR